MITDCMDSKLKKQDRITCLWTDGSHRTRVHQGKHEDPKTLWSVSAQ